MKHKEGNLLSLRCISTFCRPAMCTRNTEKGSLEIYIHVLSEYTHSRYLSRFSDVINCIKLSNCVAAFPDILYGITTIHHDKPEDSRISKMATKMTEAGSGEVPSTVFPERHKRLLPYINYYLGHNNGNPSREKFTPFLDSNALPGPFIPIVKTTPKNIGYGPEPPVTEKSPNYAEIYETLSQLKQSQDAMRHNFNQLYRKPPMSYVPIHYYEDDSYSSIPSPHKTIIETYTPTNIDIELDDRKKYQPITNMEYKIYRQKPQIVDSYVVDKPDESYGQPTKPYFGEKLIVPKPIVVYEQKQEYTQNEKPVTYIETTPKPQVNTIIDEKYIAQKFVPIETTHAEIYPKEPVTVQKFIPVETTQEATYPNEPEQYVSERPAYVQQYFSSATPNVPTENTNILAKLLKQLQNSNTLPQTLTPQNIDNSIRTLVKILNGLRKQQRLKTKPNVVVEEDSQEEVRESEEVVEKPLAEKTFAEKTIFTPGSFTQAFPANTIDGGTPGRPGIDYPALSSIPQTDFNCKKQRYKGFFGDPHTNCQVSLIKFKLKR